MACQVVVYHFLRPTYSDTELSCSSYRYSYSTFIRLNITLSKSQISIYWTTGLRLKKVRYRIEVLVFCIQSSHCHSTSSCPSSTPLINSFFNLILITLFHIHFILLIRSTFAYLPFRHHSVITLTR